MITEMHNPNARIRIGASKENDRSCSNFRKSQEPASVSGPKGKGKAIMIGDEEEAPPRSFQSHGLEVIEQSLYVQM